MILFNRFIATLFAAIGLLSLAAPLAALGQTTPLNIGADLPKRLAIWQSLQTLADPAGTYLPDQVASKMRAAVQQGTAQYLAHADAPLGKSTYHPYWASFTLENRSTVAQSWVLSFESPTQDSVALWQGKSPQNWQTLDQVDAHKTEWGTGEIFPLWRLSLAPGETMPLLMRIDGYNRMRFPVFLMRDEAFSAQQRMLASGIGFFMAIPLVVLLYVLTLMRIAEDKSVWMFTIMALGEWVGASWVSGMLHANLPALDRWLCGWIGLAGYAVLLGVSCIHAKIFLKTPQRQTLQNVLLTSMALLWLVALPILALTRPESARPSMMLAGQIQSIILFAMALHAYRKPNGVGHTVPGMLFLVVWAVYLASSMSYFVYRWVQFPISYMLMIHFVQGSIVAALLGCAVSALLVYKHQLTKQIAHKQTQHNQLYAAAHHDLWQPIQSIGLYTAAMDSATATEKSRYQRGITSAVASVHDFMEGLRKIDLAPTLQRVELDALLGPLVEESRLLASQKHTSLRVRATSLVIHTDPALLQRIVRNLLTNAIRYTQVGGQILLGVRRAKGQQWLMVYDNGIGMSPAQTKASFEAFSRFGDTSRVPEGLGIGLYSVKNMADQLGLQTWLVSHLGKGTAIGISLPIARKPP
jgi:signal transduction histidine kinase